jgi:hypothetical protein
MVQLHLDSPLSFHSVFLNKLNTMETLPLPYLKILGPIRKGLTNSLNKKFHLIFISEEMGTQTNTKLSNFKLMDRLSAYMIIVCILCCLIRNYLNSSYAASFITPCVYIHQCFCVNCASAEIKLPQHCGEPSENGHHQPAPSQLQGSHGQTGVRFHTRQV